MLAKDIMTEPVIVVHENTTLEKIARLMLNRGIGAVPVVDTHGRLCGIVTESDFTGKEPGIPYPMYHAPQLFGEWLSHDNIEQIYARARRMTAREITTPTVAVASAEEPVRSVVDRLLSRNVNHLPVVRDGVPIGMISRHDLLKALLRDGADG